MEMAKFTCRNQNSCYKGDCIGSEICAVRENCKKLYNAGYRKIHENAVVLTEERLKAIIEEEYKNALKGKVVLTMEEYQMLNYFNHRGEELLKQERKETAEKFAERLKSLVFERNCNEDYDWEDVQVDGQIFIECVDEICKEFTEG